MGAIGIVENRQPSYGRWLLTTLLGLLAGLLVVLVETVLDAFLINSEGTVNSAETALSRDTEMMLAPFGVLLALAYWFVFAGVVLRLMGERANPNLVLLVTGVITVGSLLIGINLFFPMGYFVLVLLGLPLVFKALGDREVSITSVLVIGAIVVLGALEPVILSAV